MKVRAVSLLFALVIPAGAVEPTPPPPGGRAAPIDLATTLRLAGAQNADVKLAAERAVQAQAEHAVARQQFFPWVSLGAGFRGHQENLQDIVGDVLDVEKTAVDFGGALRAQVDLGEAWFRSLATRQLARAARYTSEVQRQESIHAAALGYFDLVRAQAEVGIAGEAVRIAGDYEAQVRRAVEAGIAFAGDACRVQTQHERNRLTQRHALERRRIAAARLAQQLLLDPAVNLLPDEAAPAPLKLFPPGETLEALVQRALGARPEFQVTAARREAALGARDGARFGPLLPTLGAHYAYGGLAGGRGSEIANAGDSMDYGVGLSWRIGPGGLFDGSRAAVADSGVRAVEIEVEKLRAEVVRQVVESHTRVRSLGDQLAIAQRAVQAAQKALDLCRERREFGVGIVAETIQAEQELTRARRDYLGVVVELNQAQFTLQRAVGALERR